MINREMIDSHIPHHGETYDVIVAGGGPAGLGAAIAAALQGAKTLLLEARAFLGGVAAVGLWMPMNRMRLKGGSRGGVHEMVVRKLESFGSDAFIEGKVNRVDGDGLSIHPDYLRLATFQLLEESGCSYNLYSPVTGVIMDGSRIVGVEVATKKGRVEYKAGVVIDATGDGDVAYLAGAQTMIGSDANNGKLLPFSLNFALANVDVEKFMLMRNSNIDRFGDYVKEANNQGYVTAGFYSFDRTTIPNVLSVNTGGMAGIGNVDGTDNRDLTIGERTGIQVAYDFVRFARALQIPGLENCSLIRTGANVGVRDTRRIVGDYVLTLEDAINAPEFEDVVSRRYGTSDPAGIQAENDKELRKMKSGYAYPYRCMLPVGIEGLLVAGRCSSMSHDGFFAGRSMGNMMGMGQAAGVAAALATNAGLTPRQVNVGEIQSILRSMNVQL